MHGPIDACLCVVSLVHSQMYCVQTVTIGLISCRHVSSSCVNHLLLPAGWAENRITCVFYSWDTLFIANVIKLRMDATERRKQGERNERGMRGEQRFANKHSTSQESRKNRVSCIQRSLFLCFLVKFSALYKLWWCFKRFLHIVTQYIYSKNLFNHL